MKECPRCKRNCLYEEDVMNSISHLDNKTMICSECGKHEGLVGMGYETDEVEIAITTRFRNELKV